jgi:hypothetical protein
LRRRSSETAISKALTDALDKSQSKDWRLGASLGGYGDLFTAIRGSRTRQPIVALPDKSTAKASDSLITPLQGNGRQWRLPADLAGRAILQGVGNSIGSAWSGSFNSLGAKPRLGEASGCRSSY